MKAAAPGSSPRARGTRGGRCRRGQPVRFIPACAGNTRSERMTPAPSSVHPRVRGEHLDDICRAAIHGGSSPRARGTPPGRLVDRRHIRFIPACAGNTRCRDGPPGTDAVHPRVRGEHNHNGTAAPTPAGSSPRARGTHARNLLVVVRIRFIPACAGNTCRRFF